MKPSSGRIVLYVSSEHGSEVVIRPAVVIATCNDRFPGSNYTREECQLHVLWDGTNDAIGPRCYPLAGPVAPSPWRTSVPHDEGKAPGTWHWPPRV